MTGNHPPSSSPSIWKQSDTPRTIGPSSSAIPNSAFSEAGLSRRRDRTGQVRNAQTFLGYPRGDPFMQPGELLDVARDMAGRNLLQHSLADIGVFDFTARHNSGFGSSSTDPPRRCIQRCCRARICPAHLWLPTGSSTCARTGRRTGRTWFRRTHPTGTAPCISPVELLARCGRRDTRSALPLSGRV